MENSEAKTCPTLALLKKIKQQLQSCGVKKQPTWKGTRQDLKLVLFLGCIKQIMKNLNEEIIKDKAQASLLRISIKEKNGDNSQITDPKLDKVVQMYNTGKFFSALRKQVFKNMRAQRIIYVREKQAEEKRLQKQMEFQRMENQSKKKEQQQNQDLLSVFLTNKIFQAKKNSTCRTFNRSVGKINRDSSTNKFLNLNMTNPYQHKNDQGGAKSVLKKIPRMQRPKINLQVFHKKTRNINKRFACNNYHSFKETIGLFLFSLGTAANRLAFWLENSRKTGKANNDGQEKEENQKQREYKQNLDPKNIIKETLVKVNIFLKRISEMTGCSIFLLMMSTLASKTIKSMRQPEPEIIAALAQLREKQRSVRKSSFKSRKGNQLKKPEASPFKMLNKTCNMYKQKEQKLDLQGEASYRYLSDLQKQFNEYSSKVRQDLTTSLNLSRKDFDRQRYTFPYLKYLPQLRFQLVYLSKQIEEKIKNNITWSLLSQKLNPSLSSTNQGEDSNKSRYEDVFKKKCYGSKKNNQQKPKTIRI